MKLTVLFPSYNEAENISRFPHELIPYLNDLGIEYEIILVDDGSRDNTHDVVNRLSIPRLRLVKHEKNQGVGAALRTGIREASGDLTAMLDTDLTFHPRYIKDLLNRYRQGDADFVIGSPKLAGLGKDIEWYRRFITRSANIVYPFLFGSKITAITPIFRLYKTADLKSLELTSNSFEITVEILFQLIRRGKRCVEVPAPLTARKFGVSKLNYRKELFKHLKMIGRIFKWRVKSHFR